MENPVHNQQEVVHSNQTLSDITRIQNGELFYDNENSSIAFIVVIYKDGTRVTRINDEDGSLLEIAGDIRDSKEHITTAINGIEFYKTQAKHSDTNEKQRNYGKQQTR